MTKRDDSGGGAVPHANNVVSFLNNITLEPEVLLAHHLSDKGSVLYELNYYRQRYKQIDPITLHYLTPAQKEQERYHLRKMALLYRRQMLHENAHQKKENLKTYLEEVKQCEAKLDVLDLNWQNLLRLEPARGYQMPERPGVYQVFSLIKWLMNDASFAFSKSEATQDVLGAVNEKRLYWIWCSLLLKGVLDQIPLQLFNTPQANKVVAFPDRFTGYLSFGLYYFRFAINFYLSLKNTWDSYSLLTEEEKKSASKWALMLEQLNARKFILLNDFFWATANILCCFWLVGPKLGGYGDVLTIALLVFDVSMAAWTFAEEKSNYEKELLRFYEEINELEGKKLALEENTKRTAKESRELNELEARIAALEDQLTQHELEWTTKKLRLSVDIVYAVGLTLTFVVLTTPFMPLSAAMMMSVNFAGAGLCFALTVICNVLQGGINIYEARQSVKRLQSKKERLEGEFKQSLENFSANSDLSRQLYLEIVRCGLDTKDGQKMVTYQQAQLIRKLLIESLLPVVIFASFMFLPMGVGLGVLGATIGLAIASSRLIEQLKPKERLGHDAFPEADYQRYVTDTLEALSEERPEREISGSLSSSRPLRLFSPSPKKEDGLLGSVKPSPAS